MQDVRTNRNSYIGGSDIPVILGISPFKTRFQLLKEKAGIEQDDFEGNIYTWYGNEMEGTIRDYIADKMETIFFEGEHLDTECFEIPCKCHTDGENDNTILEIKTTSRVHDNLDEYEVYIVQLLFYMWISKKDNGILAVYNRPDDMNTEFDESRLQLFNIKLSDYSVKMADIFDKLRTFIADVQRMKDNPLMTELDLMPDDIVTATQNIVVLENRLSLMKELEQKLKDAKKQLKSLMEEKGVKTFQTDNGYKLTLVEDKPDTVETITNFDIDSFSAEHPRLYKKFSSTTEKVKKGKSGYVLITVPKEEK